MSRHEGISCDICMSSNFTGLRYKCLRCYDFDLCANCFNTGITSSRHASDHPMQRILTRADSNIFYGGEGSNANQSHSYCCSYCGRLGFTVAALTEHIQNDHSSQSYPEVLCPVCAAHPDADPNHMTDDLSGHLALIHSSSADLDPDHLADIKHLRRHNQTANRSSNNQSGGATPTSVGGGGGTRNLIRGSLLHLIDPGLPLASMGGGKDIMDPITELLSHLNNVRGRLAGNPQSVSNHLQQLGMHLTSGRGQVQASNVDQTRSNPVQMDGTSKGGNPNNEGIKSSGTGGNEGGQKNNQFLLVKSLGTENNAAVDSKGSLAQRPFFIQELFALCPSLVLNEGEDQAREDKSHSPASTSSTSFTRLPLSSSSSSTTSSPAPSSPSPILRGTQLRDSDVLHLDQACSAALEDGRTGRGRLQDAELNGDREESGIAEGEASISYPKPAAQRKRYDRVTAEGMEERIDVNSARM